MRMIYYLRKIKSLFIDQIFNETDKCITVMYQHDIISITNARINCLPFDHFVFPAVRNSINAVRSRDVDYHRNDLHHRSNLLCELLLCVCVCVCVRARARVCMCVRFSIICNLFL